MILKRLVNGQGITSNQPNKLKKTNNHSPLVFSNTNVSRVSL